MTKNTKVFLLVGVSVAAIVAIIASIIAALFYFHVLNLGNIVTGGN